MSEAAEALAPATLLAQGGGGTEIVPSINPATTYARDRDTYAPIDGRIYSHAPLWKKRLCGRRGSPRQASWPRLAGPRSCPGHSGTGEACSAQFWPKHGGP